MIRAFLVMVVVFAIFGGAAGGLLVNLVATAILTLALVSSLLRLRGMRRQKREAPALSDIIITSDPPTRRV